MRIPKNLIRIPELEEVGGISYQKKRSTTDMNQMAPAIKASRPMAASTLVALWNTLLVGVVLTSFSMFFTKIFKLKNHLWTGAY